MKHKLKLTLNKEIIENLSKSAMKGVVGGETENCTVEPCETSGCEPPPDTEVIIHCMNQTQSCPVHCSDTLCTTYSFCPPPTVGCTA